MKKGRVFLLSIIFLYASTGCMQTPIPRFKVVVNAESGSAKKVPMEKKQNDAKVTYLDSEPGKDS
jgi:hypothetical protein